MQNFYFLLLCSFMPLISGASGETDKRAIFDFQSLHDGGSGRIVAVHRGIFRDPITQRRRSFPIISMYNSDASLDTKFAPDGHKILALPDDESLEFLDIAKPHHGELAVLAKRLKRDVQSTPELVILRLIHDPSTTLVATEIAVSKLQEIASQENSSSDQILDQVLRNEYVIFRLDADTGRTLAIEKIEGLQTPMTSLKGLLSLPSTDLEPSRIIQSDNAYNIILTSEDQSRSAWMKVDLKGRIDSKFGAANQGMLGLQGERIVDLTQLENGFFRFITLSKPPIGINGQSVLSEYTTKVGGPVNLERLHDMPLLVAARFEQATGNIYSLNNSGGVSLHQRYHDPEPTGLLLSGDVRLLPLDGKMNLVARPSPDVAYLEPFVQIYALDGHKDNEVKHLSFGSGGTPACSTIFKIFQDNIKNF